MYQMKKVKFTHLLIVFGVGLIISILISPKYNQVWAPWIALPLILLFFRKASWKQFFYIGLPAVLIIEIIKGFNVGPFPLPIFLIITVFVTLKILVVYAIDKMVMSRAKGLLATLVFPSACVSMEYLETLNGGPTWGVLANSQFTISPLIQLVSITGLWGVSFMVYWFASLLNHAFDSYLSTDFNRRQFIIPAAIYVSVFLFGVGRLSQSSNPNGPTLSLAGITMDNSNLLQEAYQDFSGNEINIPPNLSQSSPLLQEASKGTVAFIENAYDDQFADTRSIIDQNVNELFRHSSLEADKGASLISWSEGIGIILKEDEDSVIQRGMDLAKEKEIYLYMGLATLIPGPVDGKRMHVENKIVSIDPSGSVMDTYLKSNPVPFAEPDYGSDGQISTIETRQGARISHVICYDADFHTFIRQAGRSETDILLVPSGDWKTIDPVHSHMAALRGIENGFSIFRPVSRALSIASDPYGRILKSSDFYTAGDKILRVAMPFKSVKTVYSRIGDIFAHICLLITGIAILHTFLLIYRKWIHSSIPREKLFAETIH
jgi:apolipoprotein N-acyltransferase